MKYSAQISFDGSTYTDIQSKIKMKGEWVENTMIWREKIKDLKINKQDDWSTFTTLESWFSDPTKFETKIWVKILENSNGLDSELITGWTNQDLDTLTTSGKDITSAIDAGGSPAYAYTNIINLTINQKIQINVNVTLNSGTMPRLSVRTTLGAPIRVYTLTEGSNILTYNVTETKGYRIYFQTDSAATNFSAVCSAKELITVSAQESLHWFGVKWGEIDQYNTFYEVSPEVDDLYSQNILPYLKALESAAYSFDYTIELVNQGAANYPFLEDYSVMTLEVFLKTKLSRLTPIASSDYISSFIFGDNYEDGSAVTTTYNMLIDYVTSSQSVFKYGSVLFDVKTWNELTVEKILEMLRVFQIYPYFDSNDKLRFEHIKFFIDKLINNAVSITIASSDNKFRYENEKLIVYEELQLRNEEAENDADWDKLPITYSSVRNRIDATERIFYFTTWYTNLSYFNTNFADFTNYFVISAGIQNLCNIWTNVDMSPFSATNNYLTFTGNNGAECGGKDFKSYNTGFTLTANVVSISGNLEVSVHSRASGLNSDIVTWSTSGAKSETLTLIDGNKTDNYLKLQWSGGPGNTFEGWVYLTDSAEGIILNTWDTGASSASNIMNGQFSKANILDDYWNDDRAALVGDIFGSPKTFNSTQYNLARKTIKQLFTTLPNPLYGLNDGTRIARIKSWERDLDTGYIDLDLTYQEDT